jgi:predicted nuclease of restriction endonuclease-like RecB superfamily
MYSITARKTIYKNIEMRSRLEADTAKFFDTKKIHWTYEPVRHMDMNNDYLPDFEIEVSGCKIYVEMKPKIEMFENAFKKMEFLKKTNKDIVLICGTATWNNYSYDNFYFTCKEISIQINDILIFLNAKEYTNLLLENNSLRENNSLQENTISKKYEELEEEEEEIPSRKKTFLQILQRFKKKICCR